MTRLTDREQITGSSMDDLHEVARRICRRGDTTGLFVREDYVAVGFTDGSGARIPFLPFREVLDQVIDECD